MTPAGFKSAHLSDGLHRLYAARDANEFPRTMMEVTEQLIACVNMSFDSINLETQEITNLFSRPVSLSQAEFLHRWGQLCHQHPGIDYLARGGQATVMMVTDFISQRQFRKTEVYQEVFRPCGGAYQIGVILPVPGHVVGMAINRDTKFSEDERRFVQFLHPHFLQAFKNAQLFTSLRDLSSLDFTAWRRAGLTRRECEVLKWITEGKKNAEIAIILDARPSTVGKHVESILAKLGVETRSAAAAEARRLNSSHDLPLVR